jgi:hypothetical protein
VAVSSAARALHTHNRDLVFTYWMNGAYEVFL